MGMGRWVGEKGGGKRVGREGYREASPRDEDLQRPDEPDTKGYSDGGLLAAHPTSAQPASPRTGRDDGVPLGKRQGLRETRTLARNKKESVGREGRRRRRERWQRGWPGKRWGRVPTGHPRRASREVGTGACVCACLRVRPGRRGRAGRTRQDRTRQDRAGQGRAGLRGARAQVVPPPASALPALAGPPPLAPPLALAFPLASPRLG